MQALIGLAILQSKIISQGKAEAEKMSAEFCRLPTGSCNVVGQYRKVRLLTGHI
jgi:hypothetical protein